jgi:hypothetical protein
VERQLFQQAAAAASANEKRERKHVQFYSISSGSRFLYIIVGRDQQSQFKRPNTHTVSLQETFSRVPLKNKEE